MEEQNVRQIECEEPFVETREDTSFTFVLVPGYGSPGEEGSANTFQEYIAQK